MTARVLFIDQSGELGGAELSLLDLTWRRKSDSKVLLFAEGPFRDRLAEAGVPVEVISARQSVRQIRRNAGPLSVLAGTPALLDLANRIAVQARDFDLLYANSQKAFIIASIASFLSRRPLIWHLHDILTKDHFSWINRKVATEIANRSARYLIANSEATAAAFSAAGGKVRNIRVIHNGIDPRPFEAVNEEAARAALCAQLGCDKNAVLLGCFSRLAPWKGQHLLVDALALLPSAHVVLVGGSLFGETAYEQQLRQSVAARGLDRRVHFLGFRDDIPALMKAVDIIVHTSTAAEPFGRVVVEGMLAGKPVVASRAGGVLEIVTAGVDGILFEPGNFRSLATAIEQVIADPAYALTLTARAKRTALDRFSIDAYSFAVESVIGEAAGKFPACSQVE